MKRFITLMATSLLIGSALTSCAMVAQKQSTQPFLSHVVLIWLKEPGNSLHREQVIQAAQGLRKVPGVLDLDAGTVVQSDRAVVEDSYDVALNLRFSDAQALKAYVQHPLHQQIVKHSLAPLMARYRVVDFAGQD